MPDSVATPRDTLTLAARSPSLTVADAGSLHWLLRVACSAEFVGHGAFGLITKAAWVPYFGVVGIPPELAWKLMPLIGTVDITLGLVVGLVRPARALLLYMAFWGLLTATIRPLAGEPIWEFVERVPNWAVPLAFLALRSLGQPKPDWLRLLGLTRGRTPVDWLLRVAVAGALVGHGAYGVILAKPAWFDYFAVLGVSQSTVQATGLLGIVGGAELVAGLLVLLFPVPTLLLLLLAAWKIGTELLRPAAGEPFWEFVERASNMLAPLALLYVRIGKPGEGSMPPRLLSNGRTPASNHPPDIRDTAHVDSSSALPAAAAERPRLRNRQTLLRAARNPDGSRPTEWNHPTSLSADRGKRTRKLKLGENGKVGWFSSR